LALLYNNSPAPVVQISPVAASMQLVAALS
jgi:hypothetical protein